MISSMHELPSLPYNYDALKPHIDEATMRVHHTKHHAGYVDKLNAALSKFPELAERDLTDLLENLDSIPGEIRTAVRNNGGGHLNHSFFWEIMCPASESKLTESVQNFLIKSFGGVDAFKNEFKTAALGRFGSGWSWLIKQTDGKLLITSTANQDRPSTAGRVILGLDVWEHAYYLKYQNRRADYIDSFFNVINWQEVERLWKS